MDTPKDIFFFMKVLLITVVAKNHKWLAFTCVCLYDCWKNKLEQAIILLLLLRKFEKMVCYPKNIESDVMK